MTRQTAVRALRAALSGKSHRITTQRMAIVEALASSARYVTARELHGRLDRGRAGIGLATVYRTLETLHERGAVSTQKRRGETAYLFCPPEHHHHAVCTKCGKVEDVPCRAIDRIGRDLTAGLRFTLQQHHLELFGLCARCS